MMKHKRKLIFLLMVLLLFSFFPLDGVLADSVDKKIEDHGYQEEEIMEVHEDFDKILKKSSGFFIEDLGRSIGMGAIQLLAWALEFFERGVKGIIGLGNFYSTSGVKDTIDNLMPFILGLFLLTLVIVGILLMLNKIEKRENLIVNILLAISMLVIIPNIFPLLDDALNDGVDRIESEKSLADSVIEQNVADLKLYVDADFQYNKHSGQVGTKLLPNPSLVESYSGLNKIDGLKFNPVEKFDMYDGERSFWFNKKELTDFKKDNPNAYNVLITRTDYEGDGDKKDLRLLRKNIFPGTEFGKEEYYRYAVNWGTIITTLLILTLATVITVVKMGRVVFDIAFHSIFGLFVAVTDISGGQRIKKMITEIVSSFAVFFVMVLILRLFILYANWLLNVKDSIGTVSYILMLLGGAWAILDAPDIVQRLLGIDAGLRSAWGTMAGAYGLAKGAQGIGKMAGKVAGGTAKGAAGAIGFAQGMSGRSQPQSQSRMQQSPYSGGSSGGGGGGNPPNPPIDGGSGDGGNPPNPPIDGGVGDDGNLMNNGFDNSTDEGLSPLGSGSKDDAKKNMRFNLNAPNEPLSTRSSGDNKSDNAKRNGLGGRRFNHDAPNEPLNTSKSNKGYSSMPTFGSSGASGSSGSGGHPSMPTFGSSGASGSGGYSSMPTSGGASGSEFITPASDERNRFYKPTLFGDSNFGKDLAVTKARAHNTAVNFKNNMSKLSKTARNYKNYTVSSFKHTLKNNPFNRDIKS